MTNKQQVGHFPANNKVPAIPTTDIVLENLFMRERGCHMYSSTRPSTNTKRLSSKCIYLTVSANVSHVKVRYRF